LSEPLARMGFGVLGVDAANENIRIAAAHAAGSGLMLRYRAAAAETLVQEGACFDFVIAMEVVEHVADVGAFVSACAKLVSPGGLLIVATINRTLKSLALAKIGAEYVLRWLPAGTHDWNRFITPAELQRDIEQAGLEVENIQGVRFDPLRWDWQLARDTDVNFMIVACRD
jgi:2-polyprenyl-6-hydroxyphenyl methylase/3-demethylubiquinone-9 3-methyltransferase